MAGRGTPLPPVVGMVAADRDEAPGGSGYEQPDDDGRRCGMDYLAYQYSLRTIFSQSFFFL